MFNYRTIHVSLANVLDRPLPFSYIRFSAICASAVRAALKPSLREAALKAAESTVKVVKPKAAV